MRDNERLLWAMGEIDDVMVADAALPYSPIKKLLHRAPIIAASLIVCIAVVLSLTKFLPRYGLGGDSFDGGNMSPDMSGSAGNGAANDSSSGVPNGFLGQFVSPGATITALSQTDGVFSFRALIDTEPERIDVKIKLIAPDGTTVYASTELGAELSPIIYCDRTAVDLIPTAQGTHSFRLDLSELIDLGYRYDGEIEVIGIGKIATPK